MAKDTPAERAQSLQDNIVNSAIGTIGTVAGLILLAVILSNGKLRKTYVLVIGLIIGDLSSTVCHIILGIEKTQRINSGVYYMDIPPQACLKIVYLFFYVHSIQQEALMVLAMAVERAAAVLKPIWYHQYWSKKVSWALVMGITSFTIMSTIADYLDNLYLRDPTSLVSGGCGLTSTVSKAYGAYMFSLVILCSSVALILSAVCVWWILVQMERRKRNKGDKRTQQEIMRDKKQIQMVISLAAISFSQFIFMVPPSITWLGKATKLYTFELPDALGFVGRIGFVVNCSLTLVYFTVLNATFRNVLWSIIRRPLIVFCPRWFPRSNRVEGTSMVHVPWTKTQIDSMAAPTTTCVVDDLA